MYVCVYMDERTVKLLEAEAAERILKVSPVAEGRPAALFVYVFPVKRRTFLSQPAGD